MIEHFFRFSAYKFMFKLYIFIVEILFNLENKINDHYYKMRPSSLWVLLDFQ